MSDFSSPAVFGTLYRDEVTGAEGYCTGIHFVLTGCTRILLEPKSKESGELTDAFYVDETRLIDVASGKKLTEVSALDAVKEPEKASTNKPGGPIERVRRR